MIRYVDPNYIKASNLILVATGLWIANYFLIGNVMAFFEYGVLFVTLAFSLVIALLIRKGYQWAKWIFIVITILGLFALFSTTAGVFKTNVLAGCISILQNILYVLAIVLLFIPSKQPFIDSSAETDIV